MLIESRRKVPPTRRSCGGWALENTPRKAYTLAQQTTITLTDDINGGAAVETIAFGIDGQNYEIDLGKKNAAALRKAFAEFVAKGRAATVADKRAASGRSKKATVTGASVQLVRDWARANGIQVAARGRVARSVVDQYTASLQG